MNNIIKLLAVAIIILTTSCGSDDSPKSEPIPVITFAEMVPKIKARLTNYQTYKNNSEYDKMLQMSANTPEINIASYELSKLVTNAYNETYTMSSVVENSPSTVANGKVVLTGDCKVTRNEAGSSTEEAKTFTATFTCAGDKSTIDDWKIVFKFNN